MTTDMELQDVTGENAEDFTRAAASALRDEVRDFDIEFPSDPVVELPSGCAVREDGSEFKTVVVRELTGFDEEKLIRALMRGGSMAFIDQAMKLGIEEPKLKAVEIDHLCLGDRDAILLGLRIATFGKTLAFDGSTCPHCEQEFDHTVDLTTLPVKRIEPDAEGFMDDVVHVLTRKGTITARIASHGDQVAIFGTDSKKAPKMSVSEANTVLLGRCILAVDERPVSEIDPQGAVRIAGELNMADRARIVTAINEKQPGPELSVDVTCPNCEEVAPLNIDLAASFRL